MDVGAEGQHQQGPQQHCVHAESKVACVQILEYIGDPENHVGAEPAKIESNRELAAEVVDPGLRVPWRGVAHHEEVERQHGAPQHPQGEGGHVHPAEPHVQRDPRHVGQTGELEPLAQEAGVVRREVEAVGRVEAVGDHRDAREDVDRHPDVEHRSVSWGAGRMRAAAVPVELHDPVAARHQRHSNQHAGSEYCRGLHLLELGQDLRVKARDVFRGDADERPGHHQRHHRVSAVRESRQRRDDQHGQQHEVRVQRQEAARVDLQRHGPAHHRLHRDPREIQTHAQLAAEILVPQHRLDVALVAGEDVERQQREPQQRHQHAGAAHVSAGEHDAPRAVGHAGGGEAQAQRVGLGGRVVERQPGVRHVGDQQDHAEQVDAVPDGEGRGALGSQPHERPDGHEPEGDVALVDDGRQRGHRQQRQQRHVRRERQVVVGHVLRRDGEADERGGAGPGEVHGEPELVQHVALELEARVAALLHDVRVEREEREPQHHQRDGGHVHVLVSEEDDPRHVHEAGHGEERAQHVGVGRAGVEGGGGPEAVDDDGGGQERVDEAPDAEGVGRRRDERLVAPRHGPDASRRVPVHEQLQRVQREVHPREQRRHGERLDGDSRMTVELRNGLH
ncbi:unnamed protein product [Phytophthora lilii]|uniref:Unnamed protein product n=1 Tax=Phytophthora lilii TaxID=2077276 RepID=A0A9W6TF84_9STRA|nr:unnamed protein product [Phytophthora lilii]